MNNKITYKVYSDIVRQNTTTIDLTKVSNQNTWSYATEVLRERFKDYRVKINHVGKTIRIEEK